MRVLCLIRMLTVCFWSVCVRSLCLHWKLNLSVVQSGKKHLLHVDMGINPTGRVSACQGCINFVTETSSFCWDRRSNYKRSGGGGRTLFRFMLLQQRPGEHPLSPGMPLLISTAINQFSSSQQPRTHPPHFPLPFSPLLYSLLALSPELSSVPHDGSQLWMRSRRMLKSIWPQLSHYLSCALSPILSQKKLLSILINIWNVIQLDLKPEKIWKESGFLMADAQAVMLKHLCIPFPHIE